MMDNKKQFQTFSYDEKKEILLWILWRVKDKHDSLLSVFTILDAWIEVTEEWLDDAFDAILWLIKQWDERKKMQDLEKFRWVSDRLKEIHKKEKEDKQVENVDDLLVNI